MVCDGRGETSTSNVHSKHTQMSWSAPFGNRLTHHGRKDLRTTHDTTNNWMHDGETKEIGIRMEDNHEVLRETKCARLPSQSEKSCREDEEEV